MSASGLERHVLKLPVFSAAHRQAPWGHGKQTKRSKAAPFPSKCNRSPCRPSQYGLSKLREPELGETGTAAVRSGTVCPVDGGQGERDRGVMD